MEACQAVEIATPRWESRSFNSFLTKKSAIDKSCATWSVAFPTWIYLSHIQRAALLLRKGTSPTMTQAISSNSFPERSVNQISVNKRSPQILGYDFCDHTNEIGFQLVDNARSVHWNLIWLQGKLRPACAPLDDSLEQVDCFLHLFANKFTYLPANNFPSWQTPFPKIPHKWNPTKPQRTKVLQECLPSCYPQYVTYIPLSHEFTNHRHHSATVLVCPKEKNSLWCVNKVF